MQLMREYYARLVFEEVREFMPLQHKRALDVGGATGSFCKVFSDEFGATAINVDPDPEDLRTTSSLVADSDMGVIWPDTVLGVANELPFVDSTFDFVLCRGVLEHIPTNSQQSSVNEMYRVTKKGGVCYIAIPPWCNPWAGHGLRPFHIFPLRVARRLKLFLFRNTPLNLDAQSYAEMSLFPITFRKMSYMIVKSGFRVVATKDVHFRLHFLARIPILREITIPVVAFIARKN